MIVNQDVGRQLRKGVVEACILGLLEHEAMYGWQLAEELISRGKIIASIGTLYPVLSRLRDQELVTTFEQPSESGPSRRYYQITGKGQQELEDFRGVWQQFTSDISALLNPKQGDTQT
ncbi:MAG: PadR family transcriptional regulator [Microbacteriaceae bacterium]